MKRSLIMSRLYSNSSLWDLRANSRAAFVTYKNHLFEILIKNNSQTCVQRPPLVLKKVVVVQRRSLFTVCSYWITINFWKIGDQASRCRHVVIVQRWSLAQVWLKIKNYQLLCNKSIPKDKWMSQKRFKHKNIYNWPYNIFLIETCRWRKVEDGTTPAARRSCLQMSDPERISAEKG
jgi:hypothetical protein